MLKGRNNLYNIPEFFDRFLSKNSVILLKHTDSFKKKNQRNDKMKLFFLFTFNEAFYINSMKKICSLTLNFFNPLKKGNFSFFKALFKIKNLLKLYEFVHRDTKRYIPEALCV
jgi:hypothetical protein